jgi:predicted ArsR family transcriptional regulator
MIDLPPPTRSGDALSQPTRARLYALLYEIRRPLGTAELAERLGLHPNGVRTHLERLAQEGLIERERRRGGRGRPPDVWMIAPDGRPGGRPPRAYGDLVRWLARAIEPTDANVKRVERVGVEIGEELAPRRRRASEPRQELLQSLSALGFNPRARAAGADQISLTLRNCPYRAAAKANQPVVCGLHRGISRGLLAKIAPRAKLTELVPRDPARAGCRLEVALAAESARAGKASPARRDRGGRSG